VFYKPKSIDCNSTPDSGPNSPPSAAALAVGVVGSRGSPTSAPIQEENEEGSQYQPGQRSSINDLPLFSSPSLPNISLGRPHLPNSAQAHAQVNAQVAAQAQAQAQAAQAHAMFAALHQHVAAAQSGCGQPGYYNPLGMAFVEQEVAGGAIEWHDHVALQESVRWVLLDSINTLRYRVYISKNK